MQKVQYGLDDEAHWLLKCRAYCQSTSAHQEEARAHTTLLRNGRSVDKLMNAMYDRNLVNDLVNYIWDIPKFVKGHRQRSNA